MAGDHAGDRLLVGDRLVDAHGGRAPRAKPAAAGRVVDLDLAGTCAQQVRRLAHPGELLGRRPTAPAEEDVLERRAFGLSAALVHVQGVVPWRARLVVRVAEDQHDAETVEADVLRGAAGDHPRQCTEALAMRRAPARPPADGPTRADRLAVARFEVGAL